MSALLANPVLALATAVSWLDPVQVLDPFEEDEGQDELVYALSVCRACFPAVYAQVLQAWREGAGYPQLDRLIDLAEAGRTLEINVDWLTGNVRVAQKR